MLRGKWWEIFNDPELNALEDNSTSTTRNQAIFENFMEARRSSCARRARSISRRWHRPLLQPVANPRQTSEYHASVHRLSAISANSRRELIHLPAEASWEPDLWGKVRNAVAPSQYAAQLSAPIWRTSD